MLDKELFYHSTQESGVAQINGEIFWNTISKINTHKSQNQKGNNSLVIFLLYIYT